MIFATEIEFKYRANNINLKQFRSFCEGTNPKEYILASGWDTFYDKVGAKGFARHRVGSDFNQLTFKRKTSESNNYVRAEDNLNMLQSVSTKQVASFLAKFGYKQNKSIYKNCFIYKYDNHVVVYYVIYDESIKEIGRFIEIEVDEDYPWANEREAWNALVKIECAWKKLGLNPKVRMRKSLYELVTKC